MVNNRLQIANFDNTGRHQILHGIFIAIFDGSCSADYESRIKKVLLRHDFKKNGLLWVKNHDFDHFGEIVVKSAKA